MTTPYTNTNAPDPLEDLKRELRVLIEQLDDQEEAGLFRRLTEAGLRSNANPHQYRTLLIEAGLRESRASELAALLRCREIAQAFVDEDLHWRAALDQVRRESGKAEGRAAAALVRRLLRYGHLWGPTTACRGWTFERAPGGRLIFRRQGAVVEVRVFIPEATK